MNSHAPANTALTEARSYPWWAMRMCDGMGFSAFLRLLFDGGFAISPSKVGHAFGSALLAPFNSALNLASSLACARRIAATPVVPPLFVIGHWRSGTTLLHELLSRDTRHAAPGTYECFAPKHFLLTSRLFKRLGFLLPPFRPMDDMALSWDSPQEDEFALLAMGLPSSYGAMAFPHRRAVAGALLRPADASSPAGRRWASSHRRFVASVSLARADAGAVPRLVLKSPTHTARMARLAEIYPGAKFVHIVREPAVVVASSMRLWRALWRTQGLQAADMLSDDEVETFVLDLMEALYRDFEEERAALPAGTLVELRYEDVVARPVEALSSLYRELGLSGFEEIVLPVLRDDLSRIAAWRPRTRGYERFDRTRLGKQSRLLFDRFGY